MDVAVLAANNPVDLQNNAGKLVGTMEPCC